MKRLVLAAIVVTASLSVMGTGAQAAGKHWDPPCVVNPNPVSVGQSYTVSVSGLPTSTVLNLWVTDPNGNTTGTPLGTVASGAMSLTTSSSAAGTWTYQVTGTNATKVYSSCTAQVS
jgi:hypothetical protein